MIATRTPQPSRRPRIAILVGVFVALGGGLLAANLWWARGRQPNFGKPGQRANVVIFLVDTLRPDRLGCYGYAKPTSPRIDALAAEGVLFEQAYAAAPWTLPTVVSLMTSTWPCEHGVLVDQQRLNPALVPLAERMSTASYATASFHANPYAGPMSGLQRGFDLCQSSSPTRAAEIEPWLEAKPADQPFFLYIHNVEPHDPYNVPPGYVAPFGTVSPETVQSFAERAEVYRRLTRVDFEVRRTVGTTDNTTDQQQALRNLDALRPQVDVLYDASVRWADDYVGSVIDLLKREGKWEDTLFILLADHGEEMGEHGGWQHDQSVYEELGRIPFIVKLPRGEQAGTRVSEVATIVDVVPTIARALEWSDLARGARGQSVLPSPGRTDSARVVTMRHNRKKYFRPWKEQRGELNIAVRDGPWKGIWNVEPDTFELYDLSADPGESDNRAAIEPERVALLRKVAGKWLGECSARAVDAAHGGLHELDDDTRRRLAALGYVSYDESDRAPPRQRPESRPTSKPASAAATRDAGAR